MESSQKQLENKKNIWTIKESFGSGRSNKKKYEKIQKKHIACEIESINLIFFVAHFVDYKLILFTLNYIIIEISRPFR